MKTIDYIIELDKYFYYPIISGEKTSIIQKNSENINVGDSIIAYFPEINKARILKITRHYAIKLNDISEYEAKNEGFYHEDLLKYNLSLSLSDLNEEDYVYVYLFIIDNCLDAQHIIHQFLKEKEGI